MKAPLSLIAASLLLVACSGPAPRPDSGLQAPPAWHSPHTAAAQQDNRQWWTRFGSPELERLVEQARLGSHDLAAAMARVRQAQASAVIAGAPLLPAVNGTFNANRQKLMRGNGYSQLNADSNNKAVDYFDAGLSASYEIDFWGGKRAARDSALLGVQASEFDQATVELTLLSGVANSYAQVLSLREQSRIAELNLANAQSVLRLVQTRYDSGSATALELAQQKSLVAAQQRQVPLVRQQTEEALITLAALLGRPVQSLTLSDQPLARLNWPDIDAGVPSDLLARRPDIAGAEARLAAARADVKVARAAMLPSVTLTANLGSGANQFDDVLRSPFYNLTAGLVAPIFNNGRLSAERDRATARQQELLESYRAAIVNGFADVEKALNSIRGLDQQRQWQDEELRQAQRAFEISQSRYQAGAADLLTVLETQRTLYTAQDQNVQLRLSRVQSSIALYKALGGGWKTLETKKR
ncbi:MULTISPECIES: efflux transporter outer membrane subunit [Pseudomonas]|uniref:Efflux transport system, outer membrane factor (OMF) lipoprotein n=1 Tax=Pseudomonas chlororaphis subsp. aureofaciens TaxID=587851 RepID=A0AAD0ZL46_9PSED|nr:MULTISPECIES: efflux transporter outer membrane subunit [Pseudomonas]AIC21243.1 RND transporter [Pseudomonas chlororaphis]AZE18463.1 Efflux transport system, outer membrane factor (OMF) lipoprotein [Pseudomonas chlororaphis subsp. aureofaciens]AZE24771.1 Efflux transport system, outer membrane factor (OMF) lipoprotein [Pseudomonas chlororaphis subsp. aureofaciens]AZE30972.1 Efflux transport system, outer membrane factor (OMF) lipoprotein [Pseudomonas chlororaphis subsp. aureofaciens]AZE3728